MDSEHCVLYCHVGYDGDRTSDGHIDKLTGYGYEAIRQQAKEAGWVDCGNRWCCPACANDATPVIIYTVDDEYVGACVFTNLGDAQEHLEACRDGLDDVESARITIVTGKNTRGWINQLRGFEG